MNCQKSTKSLLPSSQGKVHTCHASNNSWCFNDVSSLHVLGRDDPSFPVSSSYQSNVSRSVKITQITDVFVNFSMHVNKNPVWWKLVSPARVVSHFNNLLVKRLGLFVFFIAQSLKVYTPVSLFMATTDAVCPYPSCVGRWAAIFKCISKCWRPSTRG